MSTWLPAKRCRTCSERSFHHCCLKFNRTMKGFNSAFCVFSWLARNYSTHTFVSGIFVCFLIYYNVILWFVFGLIEVLFICAFLLCSNGSERKFRNLQHTSSS